MYEVIGISFTNSNRVYYFSSNDIIVEKKDKVIVETERGMQIGTVVTELINLDKEKVVLPIKTVLRKATEEDLKKQEENDKLSLIALENAKKIAKKIEFRNEFYKLQFYIGQKSTNI